MVFGSGITIRTAMRFRLEDAILASLTPSAPERYALDAATLPRLLRLFQREAVRPSATREFYRVVQVAIALEDELQSPSAAMQIWWLLETVPEIVAELRRRFCSSSALDETRRFLRREGRAALLRAPPIAPPWKERYRARAHKGEER